MKRVLSFLMAFVILFTSIPNVSYAQEVVYDEPTVISEISLTDTDGNDVNLLVMGSNETVTLNVQASTLENVTVSASNQDVLTATVADGIVTLTSVTDIGEGSQVELTVTAGTDTITIPVYLTEGDYEVVNLRMGETITCTQDGGKVIDNLELDGLDFDIALGEVIVGEVIKYPYSMAKLATGTANYNGEEIELEECLFTFTTEGSGNNYVISHTKEDGSVVYLSHNTNTKGAGYPTNTTRSVVTVGFGNNMFTLNNNSSHLFFWKNDNTKLHFDKQTGLDGANNYRTYFDIFVPAEDAPEDSEIKGYKKLTGLDQIVSGQQYLIAAKAVNNNYYILNPVADGEKYNYVAQIVTP